MLPSSLGKEPREEGGALSELVVFGNCVLWGRVLDRVSYILSLELTIRNYLDLPLLSSSPEFWDCRCDTTPSLSVNHVTFIKMAGDACPLWTEHTHITQLWGRYGHSLGLLPDSQIGSQEAVGLEMSLRVHFPKL